MALEVGIVGLPNAGKSTLFNALSSQKIAQTSPVAFTTIDPHEAVVPVPDENLKKLKKLIKPQEVVPATIKFIDIAGLVKGAHKGKGLGNMFLGKVREVNLLVHVTRGFIDPQVPHQHQTHEPGTLEQALEDIEIVNLELQLAGINKRQIYILNANENQVSENLRNQFSTKISEKFQGPTILMSAKLEEELIDLDEKDRISYLKELKIEKPGLEILIKKAYKMLGLVTFIQSRVVKKLALGA